MNPQPASAAGVSEITFHIPYPPSTNKVWRHTSRGVFLTEHGREYRKQVALRVMEQSIPRWEHSIRGRLSLEVNASCPRMVRRRDLDNLLKASLDALQACGVIEDDEHIDRITIERNTLAPQDDEGVLFVRIRQLELAHGNAR